MSQTKSTKEGAETRQHPFVEEANAAAAEEALRVLVQHLTTRPDETVRAIARLVKLLPGGGVARLASFSRGFYDVIAGMPEGRANSLPPTSKHRSRLFIAKATIESVEIEGLYSVPAETREATP